MNLVSVNDSIHLSLFERLVVALLVRLQWMNAAPFQRWLTLRLSGGSNRRLCAELLKMRDVDQQMRRAALKDLKRVDLGIDARHTERMKAIVAAYGWPGKSLVGMAGSDAAWLLVQHADHDPAFQKHCLQLLKRAVEQGEAEPRHTAYLTDRVLVAEGKPQVYGTQFRDITEPFPIEDIDQVDERRAQVGLEPLAQYAERIAELANARR